MRALILHHIDPARNMARFYRLDIQPNLFGGVSLLKEWGRIGSAEHYESEPIAADAMERQAERKRRRGYVFFAPPPGIAQDEV